MFFRSLRLGFFLTVRYLRRGNVWASLLIILIMFLTFLNVVVVRGILVGLPVGASISYEKEYSGGVFITPHSDQRHIDRTQYVEQVIASAPGYVEHSARYLVSGVIQANYERPQKASRLSDQIVSTVVGIDPEKEERVTGIQDLVVEGRHLTKDDTKGVLVGSQLLDQYAGETPEAGGTPETSGTLANIYPGQQVRIILDGIVGEYTVVGVVNGKVGENSRRVFMLDTQLRKVIERSTDKKDEIAVAITKETSPRDFIQSLQARGVDEYAVLQTSGEAQGQFLDDIKETFDVLGNGIGFLGIVVAAITVFIMIFIVALNRQKQIGILKGIGISRLAIESSYVFLSLTYALIGITFGVVALYIGIAPYIAQHPINFPFAEGVLVAPWDDTLLRSTILIVTTIFAGYLPARMIVEKNTINSILGR